MITNSLKLLGMAAGGAVAGALIGGGLIAGALVGGAVGYVIYLDKARIKEEIRKKQTTAIFTKAIVENIKRGNVNVVDIGLFSNEERIDTLTIKAKAISSDIKLYENLL